MDIERTMQFILEQQAKAEAEMAALRQRHAEWQAEFEAKSAKAKADADRDFASMREILNDTMLVQREQGRILVQIDSKLDQLAGKVDQIATKVDQLAAAQLVTEQKLQGLIDALTRGTNGHQ